MSTAAHRPTLRSNIKCPHCWNQYIPEDSLWISEHPELSGDAKLGVEHARRFLPSRFSAAGDAIDENGCHATRLACPNCHLEVPRSCYHRSSLFFSILGAPACGKSYFLASMTWKLRQSLPRSFGLSIHDADALINARLHEYEELQFLNANPDELVAIEKTQLQGDLYDVVNMGDHSVTLPRPFIFTIQPLAEHPHYSAASKVSRNLCLYDNAGESFLPGEDSAAAPVTRHLALSTCLFFLFDPTQDPRFRRACRGKSDDPQMAERSSRLDREASVRQDTILLEAIQRVRRHAGLRDDEFHQRPLVIVVTKWDSWRGLVPELETTDPFLSVSDRPIRLLDEQRLDDTSRKVGDLLRELTPEVVAAAEGFAKDLTFVPVSAIGCAPEVNPATGSLGVRPRDVKPYWVEVPILLALNRWARGLIGGRRLEQSRSQ